MERPNNTADGQDFRVSEIVDYISQGIGNNYQEHLGLELEHFVIQSDTGALVPYLDNPETGELGVHGILTALAPLYDELMYEYLSNGSEHLIGLTREHSTITLEPGAQLEISIGPLDTIQGLETIYKRFRDELDPLLAANGYALLSIGYHPSSCARDIPLIPKERYFFMDRYFETTGTHGICMMRATASTQVSIDFESEADAVTKFRIANALTPLLAFITDNAPLFEGERVGTAKPSASGLSIPKRMARTVIWNDVDPDRSMTAPHTFDEEFCFASYARTLLGTAAIFTVEQDPEGIKHNTWQGKRNFATVLDGHPLDKVTVEHILSLFFYDVRFKNYIEIRAADSLPIDLALAFTALIKGLFYSKENLGVLAARTATVNTADIVAAKASLEEQGYEALVYGHSAAQWLDELTALACTGLSESERPYLRPLEQLVIQRKTPIDT